MASVHPPKLDLGQVTGKSAYQVWLEAGNAGTVEDFLNAIKGDKGETGAPGPAPSTDDIKQVIKSQDMYDAEPTEASHNLISSGSLYKYLQSQVFNTQTEITEVTQSQDIDLKVQTHHILLVNAQATIPTLKFPSGINVPVGSQITITIRNNGELNDGVQTKIHEDNVTNVYIDGNIASIVASGALLLAAVYDGTHWYLHRHEYKAFTTTKANFVLSGRNQYGRLASTEIAHEVENNGGSYSFTLPDASDATWGHLYGSHCKLLGWTRTLNDTADEATGLIAPGTTVTFTQDDTYTYYPIYEIEEVDIVDQGVTTETSASDDNGVWQQTKFLEVNVSQLLKAKGFDTLPSDVSVSYPIQYRFTGSTFGKNAEVYKTGYKFSNGSWHVVSTGGKGESGSSTKWHWDTSSVDGIRGISFGRTFTGDGSYKIYLDKVRVGYSRYNHQFKGVS